MGVVLTRLDLGWMVIATLAACSYRTPPKIPGATDVKVRKVAIVTSSATDLAVNYKTLYDTLGLRVGSLIRPGRDFNEFRLAEDRRRVRTHAQLFGYFDAKVAEPKVDRSDKGIEVEWTISEGAAYKVGSLSVVGAPSGTEPALRSMIPFAEGDAIDVRVYRPLRRELAERLQAEGFGHARVYSRAWVDRKAKTVAWYYFVDAGPRTTVGTIEVVGNRRLPIEVIIARAGLREGDGYSTGTKKRAELSLLDAGSIRSVVVMNDADILTGPPQWPDTGGTPVVDDNGDMVARNLNSKVNLRLVVVEAPARELRIEAGAEADPARLDAFAGARTILRDALAPSAHVVVAGSVGYGWDLDDSEQPTGLYGAALLRFVRASTFSRRLDARLSARLDQDLFPGASVRRIAAGPGFRSVLADKLLLEMDVEFARAETLGLVAIDAMTSEELSLATDPVFVGATASSSLIHDARPDRIEPMSGHLLAATIDVSPGGALGSHRWLRLTADARKFIPITPKLSIGARASGGVIALERSDGVPLGARLFGGGAYGFRGHGRQRLSPARDGVVPGGLSLVEASLEARFLPFRELYGAVAFVDFGGAGEMKNPLEDGISAAGGLGLRARTFFVPISIDVSYRFLEDSDPVGPGVLDRWSLFFRIGEAF